MQEPHVQEALDPLKAATVPEDDERDVFAKRGEEEEDDVEEPKVPDTIEELPIEIRSLTERFCSCVQVPQVVANALTDSSSPSQPKFIPLRCLPMPYPTCSKTSTPAPLAKSIHT